MSKGFSGFEAIGKSRAAENVATLNPKGRLMISIKFQKDHEIQNKKFYVLYFNDKKKLLYVRFFDEKTANEDDVIAFTLSRFQGTTAYLELKYALQKYDFGVVPGKIKLDWDKAQDALKIDLSDNITKKSKK